MTLFIGIGCFLCNLLLVTSCRPPDCWEKGLKCVSRLYPFLLKKLLIEYRSDQIPYTLSPHIAPSPMADFSWYTVYSTV